MSTHPAGEGRSPPPPPPPAPPLPPQRQGFVANALARVVQPFGYGSPLPSATEHRPVLSRDPRLSAQRGSRWASRSLIRSLFLSPKVPQVPQGVPGTSTDVEFSLLTSRSTSHKTGIPIAALDISPDRTHAVLAGHNILKTIQVSDSTCAEDFNLRTSIIAYAAAHEASGTAIAGKHKDLWRATDVKWSHGQYSSTIATAAANGEIVVYDINRTGVEIARLHEHSRQVHRLGFNPHKGQLMLSGSQDGTVRLWDLRDLAGDRSVSTCRSRRKFPGNNDGVRDIRWSPADGMEFALGTDSGFIQRWDFRNDKTPLLRVSAHESRSCYSIDWHPDGKHLASGGADKNIKIWDFSSSDRRRKHIWEIRAPQTIHNVRWRPPCWSSDKQSPSRWQSTQIATSYDQEDPRIHIWDFRRPFLPFRTFDCYETPATALLWHSEDLLWSVGTAGMFTQTDINFLPKTMDHRSPNTLAIATDGQILYFSQKREGRRTSIDDVLEDLHKQQDRRSSSGERLAGSGTSSTGQGSSEDPSLLGSSSKNRHRQNSASLKSTRSSTGIPPSPASTGPLTSLDRSLQAMDIHQSSQAAAIGYVEGLFDSNAFRYLASHYRVPDIPENPTKDTECDLHLRLSDALNFNAIPAAEMGKHRLSQSLVVLAKAVEQELVRRAERGYQQRMQLPTNAECEDAEASSMRQSQDDVQFHPDEGVDDAGSDMAELTPPLAHESTGEDVDIKSAVFDSSGMGYHSSSPQEPVVNYGDFQDFVFTGESPVEQGTRESPDTSPRYLLSDFVPSTEDIEHLRPWSASRLFEELIHYHTCKLHDAQVPAYLLLYLGRWLHHSISHERAMLIFAHYHRQLVDHELYIQAAELRLFAGPEFPEIAEYGAHGITSGGPFCVTCQKAPKGGNADFCERCKQPGGECPICVNLGPISSVDSQGRSERDPTAPTALWTWCQNCGHGGHMSCMTVWWEFDNEGACPTPGCLCDCQSGTRRDEIIEKLEKEREKEKPGVISTDDWKAPESAAAQRARSLTSPFGGGMGALGSAAVGRSSIGGKKVRIVLPEEEGKDSAGEGMSGGKPSASAS